MVSLMSKRPGVHRKSEETAVPRATVVAALHGTTEVHSTEGLPVLGTITVEADAASRGAVRAHRGLARRLGPAEGDPAESEA